MNKYLATVKIFLLGLGLSQVIATFQLYLSNVKLQEKLTILRDLGYFIIPTERIAAHLNAIGPAFWGGFFFTLTLGTGLTLLGYAAGRIRSHCLRNRRICDCITGALWLAASVAVYLDGYSIIATSYFVIVPPAVFFATLRLASQQPSLKQELIPLIPLILLAMIWLTLLDRSLFLNIRDGMLLSNPAGIAINDLYYDYTLYPAEVIKPLQKKTLKTVSLENVPDGTLKDSIDGALRRHDYLDIGGEEGADLVITEKTGKLLFEHRGRLLLETGTDEFLKGPGIVLKEFSSLNDRYRLFRRFTFFSLLVGLPILIYGFVFVLVRFPLSFFLSDAKASIVAAALCFILGVVVFFPVYGGVRTTLSSATLAQALTSNDIHERIAALKRIQSRRLDIGTFPSYERSLTSPSVPERYWLAVALGLSHRRETYADLLRLLNDPHPNVVCKALEGLGVRDGKGAVETIIHTIKSSDHWYCQWYGYRALRDLGWTQKESMEKH
ncbi:MAG: HEAT repeat domain-containing protein [Deltaproteobacteria bacterium]|nr:HEAT repeat domain-containing protein [Deltaproteobacteria bacterium]